jgi:acylaminoacyl-peptidase
MFDRRLISERTFLEAGLEFSLDCPSIATPEDYEKLYRASPVANIRSVKCPNLLMLGQKDRRVPTYQGVNWHVTLKSLGVESK